MAKVTEWSKKMPTGLRLGSSIECSFPHVVRSHGGRQEVHARNRSLRRYIITISAECETLAVRYDNTTQGPMWNDQLEVPRRPGRGGTSRADLDKGLVAVTKSNAATIRVDFVATPVGWPTSTCDTIWLQVDTDC